MQLCHSLPSCLLDGCQMVILLFILRILLSKCFPRISPSKVFYSKRIGIRGANSKFKACRKCAGQEPPEFFWKSISFFNTLFTRIMPKFFQFVIHFIPYAQQ
jgi:hypothetical protein